MTRSSCIVFWALVLLPGCLLSVDPVLPPVAPPPNVPPDVVLFTVPESLIESLRSPVVESHLAHDLPRLRLQAPERAKQVVRHEVCTGMTAQQVIWAFLSHPVEVVDQGIPGSHTLLWDQGRPFAPGRFWVRLDEWGRVASGGRH